MSELPVTKLQVHVRQATGADDLLLLERPANNRRAALGLVARLISLPDGETYDWSSLPVTDFQAALLLLRRASLGDAVRSEAGCATEGCSARIQIWFRISDYLAHHQPHTPADVELAEDSGWFRIHDLGVKFRLPTAADLIALEEASAIRHGLKKTTKHDLAELMIRPLTLCSGALRRVEAAMAALAPDLNGILEGSCPDCHNKVHVYFNVEQFVVREFLDHAAFLPQDVHLLASRYRWAEEAILALPRSRRILYAEMLKQEEGKA